MSDQGIFDLEVPLDNQYDGSSGSDNLVESSDTASEISEDEGYVGKYKIITSSFNKSNIEKTKHMKKRILSEDEGYCGKYKIITASHRKSDKENIQNMRENILSENGNYCGKYRIISASHNKSEIERGKNMKEKIFSEDEDQCKKYRIISPSIRKSEIENTKNMKEKIETSDFQFLKVLGMGTYGKVYQVRKGDSHGGSRIMAMKVLKKKEIIDSKIETVHTKAERHILEVAKHPFIVELFYAFQTENKLFLALEYLPGGELYSLMSNKGIFMEDEVRFYSAELILALHYLHSLGIIYRDLKPENILFDSEGHVKLIDFGLSKENIFCDSKAYTICGTLDYMAPEVINNSGHGRAADWWSLGILIYDMLNGTPPFTGENRKNTVERILKGKVILQPFLTSEASSLIKKLLKLTVSKRLGSRHDDGDQVKGHGFYRGINWNDVMERKLKPPFVPKLSGEDDANLFDTEYIKDVTVKSPHGCALSETSGMLFDKFTYVAPFLVEN